jgi:hypothetical protein
MFRALSATTGSQFRSRGPLMVPNVGISSSSIAKPARVCLLPRLFRQWHHVVDNAKESLNQPDMRQAPGKPRVINWNVQFRQGNITKRPAVYTNQDQNVEDFPVKEGYVIRDPNSLKKIRILLDCRRIAEMQCP